MMYFSSIDLVNRLLASRRKGNVGSSATAELYELGTVTRIDTDGYGRLAAFSPSHNVFLFRHKTSPSRLRPLQHLYIRSINWAKSNENGVKRLTHWPDRHAGQRGR